MNDMNSKPSLNFARVSFRCAECAPALSDLSLSVRRGETLVLLGRSGSGKTTTLKLINRLLEPSAGEVRVEGRSTLEWDPIRLRRSIGYVIQDAGLFPHFTVERNVGLVPQLERWPPEKIHARVCEMLELVGLPPEQFLSRYPRELSGGQRQRVGVARALAGDPPLLLMDEPFGALDPLTRAEIQREFQALQKRLKKTIVFVTHDMREALLLGTRIALLEAGKLVGVFTPDEFLQASDPLAAAYVAAFRAGDGQREFVNRGRGWIRLNFFVKNHGQILQLTLEHLWLVGISMLLAVAIGLPLGILLTRRRALSKPVIGVANIVQTIPSLALFGFLLPAPWLGERADRLAITALTLYALLPVIRNTYTGILGVDPGVREAARGMGMTDRQVLLQVELPLAMGVILAGVRVATVITVGVATIAAAIGAGGLGEFIFRGVAMVDNRVILAGAIPAALLALVMDLLLGLVERKLTYAQ